MTSDTQRFTGTETEVWDHMQRWQRCINERFEVDAREGLAYWDDPSNVRYFDLMTQVEGELFPPHFVATGAAFSAGKISFEDVRIVAHESMAYVTMIQDFRGTGPDGNEFAMRGRATDVLVKIDGAWKLQHEHISFPVDLTTMQADVTCGG